MAWPTKDLAKVMKAPGKPAAEREEKLTWPWESCDVMDVVRCTVLQKSLLQVILALGSFCSTIHNSVSQALCFWRWARKRR